MRVVIIGAGKIGCGFLAPLFVDHGWQVVLVCHTEETARRIRSKSGWRVHTTGTTGSVRQVRGVDAMSTASAAFSLAIATADLVVTAVGVGNVADVGPDLARGLAARPVNRPIDVWVVENDDCAQTLRTSVVEAARRAGLRLPPVGFAGGIASVAVGRGTWHGPSAPTFVRDDADLLIVDRSALLTRLAPLRGVRGTSRFLARLHEKLYVFNAGHAICAYLGWLRGHDTIAQATRDPRLRPIVAGCLLEARRAVLAAYPALASGVTVDLAADVHAPVAEILRRFADAELADPVTRVARDPIRKLGPGDRLLGPVTLIRSATGRVPEHFGLGVACALLFGAGPAGTAVDDAQAHQLRGLLSCHGVMAVLGQVCGLDGNDEFAHAVASSYRGFVFADDGVLFPPVHTPRAGTNVTPLRLAVAG